MRFPHSLFVYKNPFVRSQMGRKNKLLPCREGFSNRRVLIHTILNIFYYILNNQHIIFKIQFGENFGCFVHWTANKRNRNKTNRKSYFIL